MTTPRVALLTVIGCALLPAPSRAEEWLVEPAYEVARSPHPFRGGGVAESQGKLAVAWAQKGGVFVRVGQAPARRLFGSALTADLLPTSNGYLAIFVTLEKPPGIKNEDKIPLAVRLDGEGRPLEPVRPATPDAGSCTPTMYFAIRGADLYIFSTYVYAPPTLVRLPLAVGGKAESIHYGAPPLLGTDGPCNGHGLHADATLEMLYSCAAEDDVARLTTVPRNAPPRTVIGKLSLSGRAIRIAAGWLSLTQPDRGSPRLVLLSADRRLHARPLATVPFRSNVACAWDGGAAWVGAAVDAGRSVLKVLRIGADGKSDGPPLVVDSSSERRAGRALRVGAAASGRSLLLLWTVLEGREEVLRATRIRPNQKAPVTPKSPAADPS